MFFFVFQINSFSVIPCGQCEFFDESNVTVKVTQLLKVAGKCFSIISNCLKNGLNIPHGKYMPLRRCAADVCAFHTANCGLIDTKTVSYLQMINISEYRICASKVSNSVPSAQLYEFGFHVSSSPQRPQDVGQNGSISASKSNSFDESIPWLFIFTSEFYANRMNKNILRAYDDDDSNENKKKYWEDKTTTTKRVFFSFSTEIFVDSNVGFCIQSSFFLSHSLSLGRSVAVYTPCASTG